MTVQTKAHTSWKLAYTRPRVDRAYYLEASLRDACTKRKKKELLFDISSVTIKNSPMPSLRLGVLFSFVLLSLEYPSSLLKTETPAFPSLKHFSVFTKKILDQQSLYRYQQLSFHSTQVLKVSPCLGVSSANVDAGRWDRYGQIWEVRES